MYLTRTELRAWSGRYQRSTVIAWLKERRIAFTLDADDWPKVARAVHDRLQGLAEGMKPAHHSGPNWSSLEPAS